MTTLEEARAKFEAGARMPETKWREPEPIPGPAPVAGGRPTRIAAVGRGVGAGGPGGGIGRRAPTAAPAPATATTPAPVMDPAKVEEARVASKPGKHRRRMYTIVQEDGLAPDAVLGFGKHTGKRLSELAASEEWGYLQWIMGEDFPEALIKAAGAQLEAHGKPVRATRPRAPVPSPEVEIEGTASEMDW